MRHRAPPPDPVCAHVLAHTGGRYCASGAARLMPRLGFESTPPQGLPAKAAAQPAAFRADDEARRRRLGAEEGGVFADAVHPTHLRRPAPGGVPRDRQTALTASSGRHRLPLQGALAREPFRFPFGEADQINADTPRQMLEKLARANPSRTTIQVFWDNARSHQANVLQPGRNAPGRQIRLHGLPPEAPPLHPIARLWGGRHKGVTHKRPDAPFNPCADAVLGGGLSKNPARQMGRVPGHGDRQLSGRLTHAIHRDP